MPLGIGESWSNSELLYSVSLLIDTMIVQLKAQIIPFLKIEFGPPHADFGSVWSPQKARKFRHMQHKWVYCVY